MKAEPDGTVTMEEISRVLEDFRELYKTPAVEPGAGIDILCHMGLAFPTGKNLFRFPALILESMPEHVWIKRPVTSPCGTVITRRIAINIVVYVF